MCRFSTRNLTWIDSDLWAANVGDVPEYPEPHTKVYCAIDFSKAFDITSLAYGWWDGDTFCMRWRHWAIRKEKTDIRRDYQRHLDKWETYPNVEICDNAVQYERVRMALEELKGRCNLVKVGYDAMGGMKLNVQDWEDEYNMVPFPQTIVSMGPSTFLFESFIRNRNLRLQSCPVVDYALSCVQYLASRWKRMLMGIDGLTRAEAAALLIRSWRR
jgi:phage terminase large subunit-like protein